MNKGKIFIISGPSGCGKSTVLGILLKKLDRYFFSISATTRAPRPGETEGKEYYFISPKKFLSMIDNNEFLEYTQYIGNYYGTPILPIYEHIDAGYDVFLDVEVEGHKNIKKKIPEAISIFIAPPSIEVLAERLRKRSTETEDKILRRLETAEKEMALADTYDYIVINDNREVAANELFAIIMNEKAKQCTVNRVGKEDNTL